MFPSTGRSAMDLSSSANMKARQFLTVLPRPAPRGLGASRLLFATLPTDAQEQAHDLAASCAVPGKTKVSAVVLRCR